MINEDYDIDNSFDNGDEFEVPELADMWADIVCGKDKQDVSAILVAPKGYGKSHTAMSLAYDTACAIAKHKGGVWQDYFPYNEKTKEIPNVACIVQKDIVQLMGLTKPYNVYLLDDVAVGMNARKFMSDQNILINEIFQLIRIDQVVTITTTMDQSYIDRIPREIIGWFIEIVEPHHDKGYNVLKVFRNKKMFRTNKMHQVYVTGKHGRYTRFIAEAPPAFLGEAYDNLRSIKTREHRQQRLNEYMDMIENKNGGNMGKREIALQNDLNKYADNMRTLLSEGYTPTQIARKIGLSREKTNRLLAHVGGY